MRWEAQRKKTVPYADQHVSAAFHFEEGRGIVTSSSICSSAQDGFPRIEYFLVHTLLTHWYHCQIIIITILLYVTCKAKTTSLAAQHTAH